MNGGYYPGALCLVVKANNKQNLGKTVTLVKRSSDCVILGDGDKVLRNPGGIEVWHIRGDLIVGDFLPSPDTQGLSPQSWLMPLSGEPASVQEQEKEHV